MATRKIAVTIAGGVSLGSYEAGALTELLYALETLNKRPGQPRYELDVLTGGSAGALTAALLARIMLYDLPGRRQHLYQAWVERISVARLLEDAPANAILSRAVISEIAEAFLVNGPARPRHPASCAPDELRLSMSLSNMHGIDYAIPLLTPPGESGFVSTFFSDFARFRIKANDAANPPDWTEIKNGAVASGSFPIAFQPAGVRREARDYPGSVQAADANFFPKELSFMDGGIFNNEPLREAVRQAADLDRGELDPNRIFLLVDPRINASQHSPDVSPADPLIKHVKRLATMVLGESSARDWLRAQRVNTQIEWRDELASTLVDILRTHPLNDAQQVVQKLDDAADAILTHKRDLFGDRYPDTYISESLQRIRLRHKDLFDGIGDGDRATIRRNVLERLLFLLNHASGLQNKSPIRLALIGSDESETAGDALFGFGGFFNETWRVHDYRRGRIKAHSVLREILGADYEPETSPDGGLLADYEIPDEWQAHGTADLQDLDRRTRAKLRDVAVRRIMKVIEPFVPLAFRWVVELFFVRRLLNKRLNL